MQVLGKWLSYICDLRKSSFPGSYLFQLRSWAVALPASTAPDERLFFGAPCKQATNNALPGSAGGGILLLHRQYMLCRVSWDCPGAGRAGGNGAGSGSWRRAWVPTRAKSTRSWEIKALVGFGFGLLVFCFLFFFFSRRQLCLLSSSVWKYCHSKLLLHECLLYFPLGNLCLGSFNQEQTLNTSRGVHLCWIKRVKGSTLNVRRRIVFGLLFKRLARARSCQH